VNTPSALGIAFAKASRLAGVPGLEQVCRDQQHFGYSEAHG
jgi:hypothetical protein